MNNPLLAVAICAVSFVAGFLWRLGVMKIRGKEVVLPFIQASSRNFTLMGIALALLSLFTIVQVERSSAEFEKCQLEFQQVLSYNAGITVQERPLDKRRDDAQFASNQALTDFVHVLLVPGVNVREQLQILDERRTAAQSEIDKVEQERKALTEARAPYPEPHCGQ
jgi:hypothetical protein